MILSRDVFALIPYLHFFHENTVCTLNYLMVSYYVSFQNKNTFPVNVITGS